jgi:hypothetical protein
MVEDPSEGWKALRQSGKGDGTLEVPSRTTGVETGFGPARYAIGARGEPRLLIPCFAGSQKRNLGATPKLDVSVTRYMLAGKQAPFIDVMCSDRNLDSVFTELVREILARLASGSSPEDATEGTISDFRELLIADARGEASRAAIVGLLGELHILKKLSRKEHDAVRAWTGPFELRHDFRRMLLALEVKTSSRSDATRIVISGSDQLLPPAGGRLALVHLRIEQADAGELCVEAAFDELTSMGADHALLLRGLSELGCADPRDSSWNRLSFSIQGCDAYRVEDGFPRIVPDHFPDARFPDGISRLEYEVDLGHAGDFRMTDAEFDDYLGEFLA